MKARFVAVRPSDDQPGEPGARLRIERPEADEDDELVTIATEIVLPERVYNPEANRKTILGEIVLTTDEVRWLHETLGQLLAETGGGE